MHGLRAKGSAVALINSKNLMWPVAEFSRSHSIRMIKVPVLYYYRISIECLIVQVVESTGTIFDVYFGADRGSYGERPTLRVVPDCVFNRRCRFRCLYPQI